MVLFCGSTDIPPNVITKCISILRKDLVNMNSRERQKNRRTTNTINFYNGKLNWDSFYSGIKGNILHVTAHISRKNKKPTERQLEPSLYDRDVAEMCVSCMVMMTC